MAFANSRALILAEGWASFQPNRCLVVVISLRGMSAPAVPARSAIRLQNALQGEVYTIDQLFRQRRGRTSIARQRNWPQECI